MSHPGPNLRWVNMNYHIFISNKVNFSHTLTPEVPQRYLPLGQNPDNTISSLSWAPWRHFRPTVNCRLENVDVHTSARGTDLPPPFFSNFLFTNLFSIKFLYFYLYTPCPPSHLGTWLCEGGGHGSEAAVSGKLAWNHKL